MQLDIAMYDGFASGSVRDIIEALGGHVRSIATAEAAQSATFDRLILLGGSDVSPFWYGEKIDGAHGIDTNRDLVEWTLTRRALQLRIPTLGICRGHQMLAVAAGGTLYQDIGFTHAAPSHDLVDVDPEVGRHFPERRVNTLHHQVVRHLPMGFRIAARSDDGLIESIYRPGYLGVQFHPELLIDDNPAWAKLFQWFMAGLGMKQPPLPSYRPTAQKEVTPPLDEEELFEEVCQPGYRTYADHRSYGGGSHRSKVNWKPSRWEEELEEEQELRVLREMGWIEVPKKNPLLLMEPTDPVEE